MGIMFAKLMQFARFIYSWHCAYVGGFGVHFSVDAENVRAGVCKVASGILQHGVTSFCPTIVTSNPEVYRKVSKR